LSAKFKECPHNEPACKTTIVLKKARTELDVIYRDIVDRVNAFMLIEGEAAYGYFAKRLNEIVLAYAAKKIQPNPTEVPYGQPSE